MTRKLVAALVETKARIEAQAQLKVDIAEMLARPKRPVNCMVCGETEHIEMDCPYLHGRARHVCDDTCPAKYPSPCLCGNQPTHERDACPFEPPEAELLPELRPVPAERVNAQLGVNPKDVGLGTGLQ